MIFLAISGPKQCILQVETENLFSDRAVSEAVLSPELAGEEVENGLLLRMQNIYMIRIYKTYKIYKLHYLTRIFSNLFFVRKILECNKNTDIVASTSYPRPKDTGSGKTNLCRRSADIVIRNQHHYRCLSTVNQRNSTNGCLR